MEEWVGQQWHRLITRVADKRYPDAAVKLADEQNTIGMFFRALGGDSGLQIEASDATTNRSRRSWMQKLAGANSKIYLAWRDERSLRLPPLIAWFDDASLNRDLYYWLAALAANADAFDDHEWIVRNQHTTQRILKKFPGLAARYERLVSHHLQQRPNPETLQHDEAEAERAIQLALLQPGSVTAMPGASRRLQAVPLWLHPDPPAVATNQRNDDSNDSGQHGEDMREIDDIGRRQAEQVDEPESDRGLITVRLENIFGAVEVFFFLGAAIDVHELAHRENVLHAHGDQATVAFRIIDLLGLAAADVIEFTHVLAVLTAITAIVEVALVRFDYGWVRVQPQRYRL